MPAGAQHSVEIRSFSGLWKVGCYEIPLLQFVYLFRVEKDGPTSHDRARREVNPSLRLSPIPASLTYSVRLIRHLFTIRIYENDTMLH